MSIASNKDKNFEYLSGIVERITYHNQENGFVVLRIKAKGHRELVTVLGNIPAISAGEYIKAGGSWHNDRDHGYQSEPACWRGKEWREGWGMK